jgi:hypothetical protein
MRLVQKGNLTANQIFTCLTFSLLAELTHDLMQVVGVVGGALHLPAG